MSYAEPIVRPLRIIWGHKYVLLLALFGGADVASSGSFINGFNGYPRAGNGGRSSGGNIQPPDPNAIAALAVAFAVIVVALLLLIVIWFFLSCLTRGALTRAIAEHDAQRPFNLSDSLRAGLASFGWILLLRLLAFAAAIVLLLPFAVLVLGFSQLHNQPPAVVLLVVAGIAYFGLALGVSIALGLIQLLALRAIVLEQLSALAAISRALGVFMRRPGRVLLIWLIQVGLGLGVGIAVTVVVIVIALIFGLGGLAITSLLQLSPLLAFGLGGLALLLVSLLIGAVTGAYFSAYWTVAYRRLELDRPQVGLAPYAAAP
ncbi:MAG: hypothetical protein JF888_11470 [Candidatus Dormibacteraeota bacterium]|uniref:Uncharacterized protein n=1 Tax=Candidatus Dormiibacter inghamiae TaxID=3127013 RepID=A0A934KKM6_9BACT|nr:hypothetical protein [Candidatus Dormibacteraeota bacterium]MBJ7607182.1 hypothetical protein [Candidatus Dormibacteraeota bacterium]